MSFDAPTGKMTDSSQAGKMVTFQNADRILRKWKYSLQFDGSSFRQSSFPQLETVRIEHFRVWPCKHSNRFLQISTDDK
jgi:hypothetical protein